MCDIKPLQFNSLLLNIFCFLVSPEAFVDAVCCAFYFSPFSTFSGHMSETAVGVQIISFPLGSE